MRHLFARKPIERIVEHSDEGEHKLRRVLGPVSLISLGIGSVIGAGLFSMTGPAAAEHAGPAITISMLLAALACLFAGLCYSEFSSAIPVAGSAYTYAYASLGEWLAWIIGWDLILEYAVAGAAVSVSWSGYVVSMLHDFGIEFPAQLAAGPFETTRLPDGRIVDGILLPDGRIIEGIINLPAVFIIVVLSLLLVLGVRESARANNVMVFIKLAVIVVFVGLGVKYVNTANYHPYIPPNTGDFGVFGVSGIFAGAGSIFFAYVGFDCVSAAAQEARNPQRDMPIGILGSLLVCTILYVAFAAVLTGMVPYTDLGVSAPVAVAIDRTPFGWLGSLVKIGIIVGFSSVILVSMLGQTRVSYSMARDGLLPAAFSKIHPKYRSPWVSALLFMAFCIPLCGFFPMAVIGDMTSIGTLFAFVIVCAAVVVLRRTHPDQPRPFRTPFVPLLPIVGIIVNLALMYSLGWPNWLRLGIWLAIGQIIYMVYGRRHSRLRRENGTGVRA